MSRSAASSGSAELALLAAAEIADDRSDGLVGRPEELLAGEDPGAVLFEEGLDDVPALFIAFRAHASEDMRLVRRFAFGLELRAGDAHLAVFVLLHDDALAAAEDRVEGAVEEKGHQSLVGLLDLLPGLDRDAAVRQHLAVVGGARGFPEMRDAVDHENAVDLRIELSTASSVSIRLRVIRRSKSKAFGWTVRSGMSIE